MTKGQIAAVFLAGAGAGVGGRQAVEALSNVAVAAPAKPVAHAVDLRRDFDGKNFRLSVYGSRVVPDAGFADLGQAKKCAPTEKQQKQLEACMGAAGAACEWP